MIDKQKVLQYLDNIERQLEDLENMPVPDPEFLLLRNHFERTKAIKYSLLVAIADIIHVSSHIVAALGLGKPKDASGAVLLLGNAEILPLPFARQIVGMVNFRNKLVHEYLPSEFEAQRLYENLSHLNDFRQFSSFIRQFLESRDQQGQ